MPLWTRETDLEDKLLARCEAGDRAAFEELVGPHLASSRSLATRLLGNLEDAEDAVQDALIKTWKGLASYHGGSFRAWFLRILYNQCTDARRRRDTRRSYEERTPVARPASPDRQAEAREALRRVADAMEGLPPKQKAALHLRVLEESSYDEIGSVLGLTPRSARVYVARARSVLRETLAGAEGRDGS